MPRKKKLTPEDALKICIETLGQIDPAARLRIIASTIEWFDPTRPTTKRQDARDYEAAEEANNGD